MAKLSNDPATAVCHTIAAGLAAMADPDRATQQQAYMKSEMPFAGLTTPILRKLCKETFK